MKVTDSEIATLFFNVARTKRYRTNKDDSEISPYIGQYKCLIILGMYGVLNQKELANKLDIRSASLSELLTKLENKKLIKKDIEENDRRVVLISLTDLGKEKVIVLNEKRKKFHHDLLSKLDDNEKEQFYSLLQKISNPKGDK